MMTKQLLRELTDPEYFGDTLSKEANRPHVECYAEEFLRQADGHKKQLTNSNK